MRRVATVCGIISVLPSIFYWACVELPREFWSLVCPWHSMESFLLSMLVALVLGGFAAWKASHWWVVGPVLAMVSIFFGGTTI